MAFRFIGRRGTGSSGGDMGRGSRVVSLGAVLCAFLGSMAVAQTASDFIDPLDEERVRIEKRNETAPALSPATRAKPARPGSAAAPEGPRAEGLLNRARESAASGAAAAQERAGGLLSRMRAALAEVAESLGLPTAGLLGLLGLLLAGLAALVGWTLFRGRRRSRATLPDGDVYARTSKATARRRPGDADPLARSAAMTDEEMTAEDFEAVFAQERADAPPASAPGTPAPAPPKTDDASTWRKPNLDRLRESIKADWSASKVRPAKGGETLETVAAASLAASSTDPSERNLGDISDGWEDWDAQVKPEDDPWGETLTSDAGDGGEDTEAVQRIRALRESLRAS